MSKISELSDGGALQSTDYLIAVRSGGNVKVQLSELPAGIDTGGNIEFGDNEKAIFGAGSDLQIYHNGSNSFIQDAGSGDLYITTNGSKIDVTTNGLTEYGMRILQDSYVSLYHDGSAKLATTATGIDVTGTVTADGLTVESTGATFFNASVDGATGLTTLKSTNNSTGGSLKIQTGGSDRLQISAIGDISFYEDTGSTAKFEWDSSEESLTIGGGSTTQQTLRVTGAHASALSTGFDNQVVKVVNTSASKLAGIDFVAANTNGDAGTIARLGGFNTSSSSYLGEITLSTRDGTGMVERVRIDSSGNVGIGTTSPSSKLHVQGTSYFFDQSIFGDKIGIGTSSPTTALTVAASGANGIEIDPDASATTDSGRLFFSTSAGSNAIFSSSGSLRFTTGATAGSSSGTERMRLDSSGNLLVGKTSDNNSTVGASLRPTGVGALVADGNHAIVLNRLTSDGDIALFYKDSVEVGSIGTVGGDLYIENNGSGIRVLDSNGIGDPTVRPCSTGGGAKDDAMDLGEATIRWRDLYLSGGVYLGGTAAANLLDDYEEGTFTPADNNLGDYTNSYGRYTKIGNLVHCFGYFTVQSNSNANPADLTMPFTYGFSAQTATIGTVLTNEAGNYYLKSTSSTLLTIVDEDEVAQTLADFSTKTVHFNVTFHVA